VSTVKSGVAGMPSESVREVENQDGAVLLDIRHRICLFMTPMELQVWRLITLNKTIDQIVYCLGNQFPGTAKQVILEDVVRFVDGLRGTGVLASQHPAHFQKHRHLSRSLLFFFQRFAQRIDQRLPRSRRLLVWRAFLGLLLFDLCRLGKDFGKIQALVGNWAVAESPSDPDSMDKVCAAMNHACVWYPKYVACAQRSAVTTCLLRSCSVRAQMVIGAQTMPFKAHAWTEVNGSPVNERRNVHSLLVWERC
jgi:hypothetical protein